MLDSFQNLPLAGAAISAVIGLFFFLLNGYKEKQEGRREAELEYEREARRQDNAIRERSDNVEDTAKRVRDRSGDDGDGMPDEQKPDYNFRD